MSAPTANESALAASVPDAEARVALSSGPARKGSVYSLNSILINCEEAECPDLRSQLSERGVTIENEFVDVKSALAGLRSTSGEKKLLVINLSSGAHLRQLERLNDSIPGWPVLGLFRPEFGLPYVLQAMRSGAAQVVPLPLDRSDLALALDRIARQFGHASSSCTVVAISGATGGCGATTIAINLAGEIARLHGIPCILAELCLGMGRLASYLDIAPRYSTFDLLNDPERIDLEVVRNSLTPVSENFQVLAGPYKGISTVPANAQALMRVVDYLRRLAQVVILDMHTFDEAYFQMMAAADRIVLIGEQKVPSVHALKTVRDELQKIDGAAPQLLVINRYNAASDLTLNHVQELLGVSRMFSVTNDWSSVGSAIDKGRLLSQENPKSRALADIDTIADTLLGTHTEQRPKTGFSGFLKRLFSSESAE